MRQGAGRIFASARFPDSGLIGRNISVPIRFRSFDHFFHIRLPSYHPGYQENQDGRGNFTLFLFSIEPGIWGQKDEFSGWINPANLHNSFLFLSGTNFPPSSDKTWPRHSHPFLPVCDTFSTIDVTLTTPDIEFPAGKFSFPSPSPLCDRKTGFSSRLHPHFYLTSSSAGRGGGDHPNG